MPEDRLVPGSGPRHAHGAPLAEPDSVAVPGSGEEPLVVRFPEPLDEALLRRLVWVERTDGRAVDGVVTIVQGETAWSFRPSRPWEPGAYALRLHPALEDRAGNRFDRLFDREVGASAAPASVDAYSLPFTINQ